jgi:flagellar hook assembly protein FlgD
VRGIQRYHVLSNGWNDIGYNFLVDKYGRIFEGRGGGLARNVVGAHAQGFNTGSVGVAVLGTYGTTRISSAARSALERLLAWRLDVAHVDPVALVDTISYGSDRFPAGRTVRLRAISGHRDTGYTSCPGNALYGRLGAIAANVVGIGLPKLYDPEVSGSVGDAVRFTGRLSAPRAWAVQVLDAGGAVVAQRQGNGTAIDWTWDATGVPFGAYTWQMSAGAEVRPAAGDVPSPPPLDVTGLAARPATLTPNGDWSGEQTAVSFVLSRRATVVARVENASSGALVRTILPSAVRSAGTLRATWDGRNGSGALVADGRYRLEVTATSGSEQVTRSVGLKVDRTLGGVSASPAVVSPNGDGRRERLRIGFALTRDATVRVLVRRSGTTIATVLTGSLAAGAYAASWDGLDDRGKRVSDGSVTAVVRATASLGRRSLSRPARLDATRPVVRVLSLTRRNKVARVRFSLSEEADVKIWLGRRTWDDGAEFVVHRSAGTHVVRRRAPAGVVRLRAVDLGLTRSAAVSARR